MIKKWQQLVTKLPLGHNLLLIEKIKDKNIRKMYAENTIKNGWSRNILAIQIETEFHERVEKSNNDFNAMLPPKDSDLANNIIKEQYIFDFITLKEQLPKELIDKLPTEEEINLYLNVEEGEN